MKIVTEYPPNYEAIEKVFTKAQELKAIFCYGDTIYNPFNIDVTPDLEVHEGVHSKQQGEDPAAWWEKYLADPQFRLEQEIEAYGTQYAFARFYVKDSKLIHWLKWKLADTLSGELYGNLITHQSAENKIRKYAKSLL